MTSHLISHLSPQKLGGTYIIGADEVGKGSLAGPVCVGAFMCPLDHTPIEGAGDSKKTSPTTRRAVLGRVKVDPLVRASVSFISAEDINEHGMSACLWQAYKESIELLMKEIQCFSGHIAEIRIDGSPIRGLSFFHTPVNYIIKGDLHDWRIGCASIIAKEERDSLMKRLSKYHKPYGWDSNKGYGTKAHRNAIKEHGLTPQHRAKFCRRILMSMES